MNAGCFWIRLGVDRWIAAELTTDEGLPPLGPDERLLRGSAADLFRAAHAAGKSVWLLGRLQPQQLKQTKLKRDAAANKEAA